MENRETPKRHRPTNREIFEASYSGAEERPWIPRLRGDKYDYHPLPRTLEEFREQEGRENRKVRLKALWRKLPTSDHYDVDESVHDKEPINRDRAEQLRRAYANELLERCGNCGPENTSEVPKSIGWNEFKQYAQNKEVELWSIFQELDLDGNGHIDASELTLALRRAGINLAPSTLNQFMSALTTSPHSHAIAFHEFRDFLLLLPRKVSTREVFRYFEMRKFLGDDGKGSARVTMEGDVSLSAEDKPPPIPAFPRGPSQPTRQARQQEELGQDGQEHDHSWWDAHSALRYLLAGGVAGIVSRTATAPFDRLKIFLMTRSPDAGGTRLTSKPTMGAKAIARAVVRIYTEGGVLAFWTGNGLNVAKIFPESAIKFWTYESSKRAFAKYADHVDDSRDISSASRFIAGGAGGITSQLSIYPIETLKTQMMSSSGEQKRTLMEAMRHLWKLGRYRAYYRGLTTSLVGVFPYSAIDMSSFEFMKLAYLKSTGKEEPGVMATLAFGSISGSVGATSVYPLNLVRTRLQASGSTGHPQSYSGFMDVWNKTIAEDGVRGLYRGLVPTLAKVVPAVSISYVVYEHTKRKLGM